MNRIVFAAGAAALALTAGTANAAVVFYSFGTGAPTIPLVTDFSQDTVGLAPTHAPSGFGWSGNGIVMNTTSSLGAHPAIANGVYGTGNYISIIAGHSETLTFAPGIKELELYVGSLDTFNDLTFTASGSIFDFSGSPLGLLSGAADGGQTQADTNGVFLFTFANPVSSLTMNSSGNSLEISKIYASSAVPEPLSWAMMIVGLGTIGGVLRVRRRSAVGAAVA
jgi:hypothetical protein